jgi:hypothetical protein
VKHNSPILCPAQELIVGLHNTRGHQHDVFKRELQDSSRAH